MPDHELARLSGDFSESRSWKKLSRFQVNLQLVRLLFLMGHLTGRLRNRGGGLLLGFLPYTSNLLHPPPPKKNKISKKQRRLGKWLEAAVPEFPEATLAPTPRGLHRHTQRGSRCGWSLACSGLAQVPAPPGTVWIPRGPWRPRPTCSCREVRDRPTSAPPVLTGRGCIFILFSNTCAV